MYPKETPRIPVTLSNTYFHDGVHKVMEVVRPDWAADDVWTRLTSKVFTDGITNKLIGYFLAEAPRDVVIVKIYGEGTEHIIDRDAEITTMKFLNTLGMGSKLYGIFDNGIVYEFIPGKTLDPESCRDPTIYPLVAAEMAKLHSIPLSQVPQSNRAAFWTKITTFLQVAVEILVTNPAIGKRFAEFGLTPSWARENLGNLKTLVDCAHMPYSFCHNDILLPNIVYDETNSKLSFIDFEYASVNHGPFDVANHFNEFAGVDNADFSLCPDHKFRTSWISVYLKHWQYSDPSGTVDVNQFQEWVDLCIPLSHLFWLLWTVIQVQESAINFDYVGYAKKRFVEFERKMKSIRANPSSFNGFGIGDD